MQNKEVWPGWKTVRRIGSGSYGAVYEVRRDVFGRSESAAVKCISIPKDESDIAELRADGYNEKSIRSTFKERMQRITDEYSLMRKLNGTSNVVSCDDIRCVPHKDGIGWDIYIRMELLTCLQDVLPRQADDEFAVGVGIDICRALKACGRYNIVHRDIKPQNLFVSPNGDYKLGDFGIARTMERADSGTRIGTMRYMAPEVFYSRPYNQQVDIYSLGLVLYWILNEYRMPFLPLPPQQVSDPDIERASSRRLGGERLPPPAHGTMALKMIVLKACAFDPAARYRNADEMLSDLQKYRHGDVRGMYCNAAAATGASEADTILPNPFGDYRGPQRGQGSADIYRPAGDSMRLPTDGAGERYDGSTVSVSDWESGASGPAVRKKQSSVLPVILIAAAAVLVVLAAVSTWLILKSHQSRPAQEETEETVQISTGDIITFGSYNGADLAWIVLDCSDDGCILIISEDALLQRPYSDSTESVTWADSSLRSWLNDSFYNQAFTQAQQDMIRTTTVVNEDNSVYQTSAGPDTRDCIFLLSDTEELQYFSTDAAGIAFLPNGTECWWWLRSPGQSGSYASAVNYDGAVDALGAQADRDDGAVRPAMWIRYTG